MPAKPPEVEVENESSRVINIMQMSVLAIPFANIARQGFCHNVGDWVFLESDIILLQTGSCSDTLSIGHVHLFV